MKKLSKEEKKSKLIAHIYGGSKSWSQLEKKAKELGISKTSLSRYLNELREENTIKKTLKEGQIKYVIDQESFTGDPTVLIKHLKVINTTLKEEKKIVSKLREAGVFDKGINNQNLKELINETRNLQHLQEEEEFNELTLRELISFLLNLPYSDSVNPNIEFENFKLKVDSDWEKDIEEGIEENNHAIKKIKEEKHKLTE